MKKTTYFNYIGGLSIPDWVVDSCPQSGDVTSSIKEFMQDEEIKAELAKIDREELIKELTDYGAWDDEELSDHRENLMRILWIAIGNIQDGEYDYASYVEEGIKSGEIDADELKEEFVSYLIGLGYYDEDAREWADEHFQNLVSFEKNGEAFEEWFSEYITEDEDE